MKTKPTEFFFVFSLIMGQLNSEEMAVNLTFCVFYQCNSIDKLIIYYGGRACQFPSAVKFRKHWI